MDIISWWGPPHVFSREQHDREQHDLIYVLKTSLVLHGSEAAEGEVEQAWSEKTHLTCLQSPGGRRLAGPAWQQEQNRAESQVWVVEGTEHADGLLIASEKSEMMTPGFLTEYKDEWMAHLLS